jgi:hypothetical protein
VDAPAEEVAEFLLDKNLDIASISHTLHGARVAPDRPIVAVEDRQLHKHKENAVRRRLILIAATWAAVVGLAAGSAHAQSPTPPGGQFVLSGVVMLEGERGLAFVQEPNFTNNKVVTVRLGDSVGPYRV